MKRPLSCEFGSALSPRPRGHSKKNRLYRFREGFRWSGVRVERYKRQGDDFKGVIRQVIAGDKGEALRFQLRYFEIEPGGYSSHEWHNHEHVVVCVRGRGRVKLGKRSVKMEFLDTLYIAPRTPHRLYNPYDEPFGFFCIVNSKRDRPKRIRER